MDINGNRVDRVWLNPVERWAIEKLVLDFGINKLHIMAVVGMSTTQWGS